MDDIKALPTINEHSNNLDYKNISTAPDQVVIILGMHRSGTSCLTGSLQQAGLNLGEHSTWNPHNTKGNRENNSIVELHEDILLANHCSWHAPKQDIVWTQAHKDRALNILKDNHQHTIWGFKDPRTIFTINGWLNLNLKVTKVGIFRHPYAVAQSLLKRGAGTLSYSEGIELWYQYNSALLKLYKNKSFTILSFDWNQDTFHSALDKFHIQLQLPTSKQDDSFYEASLVHNRTSNQSMPWKVNRLYGQLMKISNKYK